MFFLKQIHSTLLNGIRIIDSTHCEAMDLIYLHNSLLGFNPSPFGFSNPVGVR